MKSTIMAIDATWHKSLPFKAKNCGMVDHIKDKSSNKNLFEITLIREPVRNIQN